MSKVREEIPEGSWPRLMRAPLAAAYLDISPSKLRADVKAGRLPKAAVMNPPRWDRKKLDAHLDGESQTESSGSSWLKKLEDAHTT